jgi:alkylation response protein AidB-like acyl-CoA dehydrogenase
VADPSTVSLLALGLVARAVGAARAGHELAVQHAIDRVQFGQPIGSFQAVSHRLVDAAVELAGWDALVGSLDGEDPVALLTAVVWGRSAALRAISAAQRTLGAMGYFDDHALPSLFRRVHLDLDRQRSLLWAEHELGRLLLERPAPAGLGLGPEGAAIVERLTADLEEIGFAPSPTLEDDPAVVAGLGARGWIAPGLPADVGGLDASTVEQMAIDVELQRRQVPARVARGIAATLAGVLDTFGSDVQRAELLPRIAAGDFRCYLGYSEPDVGSDLAALRTRATRDGDEWVVDGTKMWGTGAHRADYVWLAARTAPTAGREGTTVFLAPTRLPGWSCTEHRALSGEVACSTVFDGVRIPDSCRVGEVDGGWPVITSALAAERVVMAGLAGEVGRQIDELTAVCRHRGTDTVLVTLAELAARRSVAEALLVTSTRAVGELGGFLDAAMAKLVTSELAELVARRAHDLLGVEAAVGSFDQALRLAPMYVIGGGTADIQRNLIARGLGLPRGPRPR